MNVKLSIFIVANFFEHIEIKKLNLVSKNQQHAWPRKKIGKFIKISQYK